jgi:hypothetical protein
MFEVNAVFSSSHFLVLTLRECLVIKVDELLRRELVDFFGCLRGGLAGIAGVLAGLADSINGTEATCGVLFLF